MAQKKQTKPNPPIKLVKYATELARIQISEALKNKDILWLHESYKKTSYDQLNFIYKNQNFSIIIDIQDPEGVSYTSKDIIKRQSSAIKKFGLIPCKFPVIVQDAYALDTSNMKPKTKGLNLFHSYTDEPISPTKLVADTKIEFSEFELLHYCIRFVIIFLQSKGCKVTYYQDTVEINPQICFIDPAGTRSWVIVRHRNSKDEKINYTKGYKDILLSGNNNVGYYAELEVISPQGRDAKLYRGDATRVNFIKFEKIHSLTKISDVSKNDIMKENMHDLVLQTMSLPLVHKNQRTHIYNLLHYKEWLLKMGRKHFGNPDKIPKRLVLVPIKYDNGIECNPRFGLPVYIIDKKSSEYAKRGYVRPQESLMLENKYMLLIRRIYGQEVNAIYSEYYKMLIGNDENDILFAQSSMIYEISKKFGNDAAVKALECCRMIKHDIAPNELANGSPAYRFMNENRYFISYICFLKYFLQSLKLFAELPQVAYSKAVSDILSAKGFVFDFTHPKNTFINFDTKEFLFIDVFFDDENMEKSKDMNPLQQFRDVILGYNHNNSFHPKDFVFYPENRELFEEYTKIITQKINKTAPKKYKILNDY